MTPAALNAAIKASGLSNTEYARRLSVSYRHLNRMLAGERPVTARTAEQVQAIADAGDGPRAIRPDRLQARCDALSIRSQADLARLAGASQQTINGLFTRPQKRSALLPRLAEILHTSQAYLLGESDDPDEGAGTGPAYQHVMVQAAIPAEPLLVDAIEAIIAAEPGGAPRELAQRIAQALPGLLRSRPAAITRERHRGRG